MARRPTPRLIASSIALSLFLSYGAMAQTNLAGTRVAAPSTTAARFTLGLSKDSGTSFVATAVTSDSIRLIGTVIPEASQVGDLADIYVVANYNGQFFMRNTNGAFVPWNGQVPALVPFLTGRRLTASYEVDFLTGKIPYAGNFALFLGYKAADGVLTYTPSPLQITMTAPVVVEPPPPPPPPTPSGLELAQEFFNSKIETPVVQSLCATCHISNGIGAGSGIVYVSANNSNHFSLNFTTLRSAFSSYGRVGLLSRSMGGNGHVGGQVFSSTNQQSYKDFDSFLQMLEKL